MFTVNDVFDSMVCVMINYVPKIGIIVKAPRSGPSWINVPYTNVPFEWNMLNVESAPGGRIVNATMTNCVHDIMSWYL